MGRLRGKSDRENRSHGPWLSGPVSASSLRSTAPACGHRLGHRTERRTSALASSRENGPWTVAERSGSALRPSNLVGHIKLLPSQRRQLIRGVGRKTAAAEKYAKNLLMGYGTIPIVTTDRKST